MEQNEDASEEREEDPEPRLAEEEHERKLVEIEDQSMDHPRNDARGTKRKTQVNGEHEEAKRQNSMIVSCLREEELTRRDIHEAGDDKREIQLWKRPGE